jgi:alpha-L-arabinofuranosidase
VGTWNTQAEFKDIKVTAPDGNVLFSSDFSRNSEGWKFLGDGQWTVQDGALRQTAEREFVRALAGDKSWKDYTLELKARKIAGREGFLVLFQINDDEDRVWWNLGGWNNTQDALELDETLDGKPETLDAGRWYDIRVKLDGARIQCWLDGKLIHDLRRPRQITRRLYASATQDSKSGDIILKVVNGASAPVSADINLRDAKNLSGSGRAIVLTSASPKDENSLEQPNKVSPKTQDFQFQGPSLHREFPGNSVTILRFGKG